MRAVPSRQTAWAIAGASVVTAVVACPDGV
jgi:hypothetical protein